MRIVIESHIPFIKGILEAAGHDVRYLAPEEFLPDTIRNAEALIVRTRTCCNQKLLDGTDVHKIATATIGTDHIDLDYCHKRGIEVSNAPGCNAPAVAQYVLASLSALNINAHSTIGIVGVGHVGSIVNRWAKANGFRTLLYDPPLGLRDNLTDADVITFHTPLDATTRHMANADFFSSCQRRPIIINAARGAVVDTLALNAALKSGQVSGAVVDCWENEPQISDELLHRAAIATPHIAGYSIEGKQRATAMAIAAIDPSIVLPIAPVTEAPSLHAIAASYNPLTDSATLKADASQFEKLRNSYTYRSEP